MIPDFQSLMLPILKLASDRNIHTIRETIEVTDESGKPELVDVGFVGKITRVNKTFLESLLSADIIPVISPVAEDNTGQALNINADTMAGAIAGTLGAEKLILLTDTPGILIKGNLADSLSELQVNEYISSCSFPAELILRCLICYSRKLSVLRESKDC